MGEYSVTADLGRLHALADQVAACADRVAEVGSPTVDPGDLPGSTVSLIAGPDLLTGTLVELAADIRAWAQAITGTSQSFQDADARNADGIGRA